LRATIFEKGWWFFVCYLKMVSQPSLTLCNPPEAVAAGFEPATPFFCESLGALVWAPFPVYNLKKKIQKKPPLCFTTLERHPNNQMKISYAN